MNNLWKSSIRLSSQTLDGWTLENHRRNLLRWCKRGIRGAGPLARWMLTEMRWKRKAASLSSPDTEEMRRPSAFRNSMAEVLRVSRFSTAIMSAGRRPFQLLNKQSSSDFIPTWLLKECASVLLFILISIVIMFISSGQLQSDRSKQLSYRLWRNSKCRSA